MSNRILYVAIALMAVVFLAVGMLLWGAAMQTEYTTERVCLELGFDGQTMVDNEFFCYTACPFDAAVRGECLPGDSGVEHVNPD